MKYYKMVTELLLIRIHCKPRGSSSNQPSMLPTPHFHGDKESHRAHSPTHHTQIEELKKGDGTTERM